MTTWPVVQLRRVCRFAYGDSLADDVRLAGPVSVYGSNGRVGEHDRPNTRGPVLVIGRKGSFGKIQYSRDPVFSIDTTFYVDRTQTTADLRWLYYALSLLRLDSLSEDVGVPGLSRERAYSQRLPLPPVEAQRAIAGFLDAETARIEDIIERRVRSAALVKERFAVRVRSMIATAAQVQPLKRHWRVIDCKHRTPTYTDAGYPVVSPGDVTPGRLDLSRCHRFVGDVDFQDLTDGRRPRQGDIVYSRNASIGIAAYVDSDVPFTMGQDVCLITSPDQDQRFLTYALNSLGLDQLEESKIGSTFSRVNISQIVELLIPTPAVADQRRIADTLDRESEIVQRVVTAIEQQIVRLREHRQALITAAVTGELKVA